MRTIPSRALLATAALAAMLLLGAAPAAAGADTTLDLTPLMSQGVNLAATLLSLVALWVGAKVRSYLGIRADNALGRRLDAVLLRAIEFGQARIEGAVKGKPVTVEVGSAVVKEALDFASRAAPDTLAHFGISQRRLAEMLWARLPGVEGEIPESVLPAL